MEAGFFPLDQELQVPDGHLLPHAQDTLISMSSELPFERAVKHLERTLGVVVIGAVECRKRKDEDQIVTTKITYFARQADAATFADQGSRGTTQARYRASQGCVYHPGWGGVDPGFCARPSA